MKTDQIIQGYRARGVVPAFDDTPLKDQWQLATYIFARGVYEAHNLQCIVDVGCGSAYKLTKLFKDTIVGIEENQKTLEWLRKNRPLEGIWLDSNQYQEFLISDIHENDGVLLMCSDVIEHVKDPVEFFGYLLSLPWQHMIIGTPVRELGNEPDGPPGNIHHYREWQMSEFRAFLDQWKDQFDVRNHCIINPDQRTQIAWLERKSDAGQETESNSEEVTGESGQDSPSSSLD